MTLSAFARWEFTTPISNSRLHTLSRSSIFCLSSGADPHVVFVFVSAGHDDCHDICDVSTVPLCSTPPRRRRLARTAALQSRLLCCSRSKPTREATTVARWYAAARPVTHGATTDVMPSGSCSTAPALTLLRRCYTVCAIAHGTKAEMRSHGEQQTHARHR